MTKFKISSTNIFIHIFGNKGFEVEWNWHSSWTEYFYFSTGLNHCTDHAGFHINFQLLWVYFAIGIFDYRHWDHENDRWESYCQVCDYPLESGECKNIKCVRYNLELEPDIGV